ncbi:MAG: TolB family protein, partial [Acidimicrobiales bacterium]
MHGLDGASSREPLAAGGWEVDMRWKRSVALTATVALVAATVVLTGSGARAAFPGANGRIAFTSVRDGNFEIYTVEPDGSGLLRLTNNQADDEMPAWSPDGTRIAFVSNRDASNEDIYTMNADGSGVVRITDDPSPDFDPAWSPD